MLRSHLKAILERYYTLDKHITDHNLLQFHNFLADKRNASLGDGIINLVYSYAKSIAAQKLSGVKISDTILVGGYKKSQLRSWLIVSGQKKDQANALEALIFYVWLVHHYSIEEMSLLLIKHLNKELLSSTTGENRTATEALTNLFDACHYLLYKAID